MKVVIDGTTTIKILNPKGKTYPINCCIFIEGPTGVHEIRRADWTEQDYKDMEIIRMRKIYGKG